MPISFDLNAHAQSFWATLEVSKAEIIKDISMHHNRDIKLFDGPLDKLDNQVVVEYWADYMARTIESQRGKLPCHIESVTVGMNFDSYNCGAVVYLLPEQQPGTTIEPLMKALSRFLEPVNVTTEQVLEAIENRMRMRRFDPDRLVKSQDESPIKHGDTLVVEVSDDSPFAAGREARKAIVLMTPAANQDIYNNLLDKPVNTTAIVVTALNPAMRKAKHVIKVLHKADAPPLTDFEFLAMEEVPSMQAYQNRIRREMEIEQDSNSNFTRKFDEVLGTNFKATPMPGPWVMDRTQGFVEFQVQTMGERQFLKQLGVKDRDTAVQACAPSVRWELLREVIAIAVLRELDIPVTDDDIQEYHQTNRLDTVNWYTRLCAIMDASYRKAYKYYQSKGQDRGQPKSRLILP